ncbi:MULTISPECIES: exodeoxyribonuclease VII small subunit [Rothia]|uniref:Exodeoxyribonuclease 7 small subunit n=1 Tax=Rothia kristinae TaxID=37923 RepID=A0A0Q3EPD6_9MICC|nr:exodeoxyribonuclease VII small subunit [Rothia kristinae]TDP56644.1 exodeoxyribonuclease VII small subunit [Kocuria sp. AG109]KTR38749.1 exodeoxyribonuclease VII small subunit [Rothia kristinae]KTR61239.1 exodeoxyribonuclease VII small subunit [Rothia kristinae]KTR69866.1 exodeoxyribonuclease VII small subunit [Rothia kristinae]KTR73470.1 exodeoxyribonuclease VII small subunit [Rothia kristinae]
MTDQQQQQDAEGFAPVERLSYEQAREELMGIVSRLESGASSLEESLRLWERGEALAQRCEQWLDGARERLDAAKARRADAARD